MQSKSTHVAGGLPPMPSWRACCRRSPGRLDWVSYCRSRDAVHPVWLQPKRKIRPRAKQQIDTSPGKLDDVAPDDVNDTPSSCGSVPVSDDGAPAPDDEEYVVLGDGVPSPGETTPAPVDDAPAVVADNLSSSGRRLLAYIAAVCLGCALVCAPSLQQYPPWACCPGLTLVGVSSQRRCPPQACVVTAP